VRHGEDRQRRIEIELAKLGIRRVIWLEGDPCEPGTSGHVDGYVLLAPSGVALVEGAYEAGTGEPPMWREHDIDLLENAEDAHGRRLKVKRVRTPGYLNAYVTNGAVITARFGDPERDAVAREALARAFPGREIVMLRVDHIFNAGGGIHCLTQPMPLQNPGE
jgi:agmatine deiminase